MIDKPIIIALDFAKAEDALKFSDSLDPEKCRLKVGKELFTCAGPRVVLELQNNGFEVFLDLKFHDIPNTVANACRAAADMGVWMVNIHAHGGRTMMNAAREAILGFDTKLIAVTVLTSMDANDLSEVGVNSDPEEQVLRLAKLSQESGLDGVVCSPLEIQILRKNLDHDFVLVTPGIRIDAGHGQDQKRTMGPKEAIGLGSNWLVIGRPIIQASKPIAVLDNIINSIDT